MDQNPVDVLLIEDNLVDAALVQDILSASTAAAFAVEHASTLAAGLECVRRRAFDLILTDLTLPDAHGLDTFRAVHAAASETPVVVFSSLHDETLAIEAVKLGAQDYLLKGRVDADLLVRAIRYAIERKRSESYINQLAYYDSLTGLPNRMLLNDRLTLALIRARRKKQALAVMFLDLDNFKTINDTLGHVVGDLLLKEVSERLKRCLREADTVARLGGDEFTILLPDMGKEEDVIIVAERVLVALKPPCLIGRHELYVTASIGISRYPSDGEDDEALLKHADAAMYRAKEQGKNCYQFFSPAMNVKASERLALGNALRRALERDEFSLYYQPQFDLETGRIVGVEALVRWHHPDWGLVPPGHFIALAEELGLIVPIGAWVLRTACRQNKRWQEASLPSVPVAVNLSHRQFSPNDLVATVRDVLRETALDPRYLELELTESGFMHNKEAIILALREFKALGVRLTIDDFGAGYSSFKHLKVFPIDALKIDRSFIQDIPDDPEDAVIVTAIIAMGHSLRLKVIAEGVETPEQYQFLREKGCDSIQGYYLSSPVSPDVLTQLLRDNR
jgi:diguanylate cyclase (GGDEF)-like protein